MALIQPGQATRPDVETREHTDPSGAFTTYTITVDPTTHPAMLAAALRRLPVAAELVDARAHHDGSGYFAPAAFDGIELVYRTLIDPGHAAEPDDDV